MRAVPGDTGGERPPRPVRIHSRAVIDPSEHPTVRVAVDPDRALKAVGEAAEDWTAAWEPGISGGRLELPVSAGLRHGRLTGRVDVASAGGGHSDVVLRPEHSDYRLWLPAIAVLLIAAGGGALTVLWPFYPELLPLAPFGAVFALVGWFLVISRLQNRGPQEFLELVALHAGGTGNGAGDEEETL